MPSENKQTRTQSHFVQSETLTLNSCRSLDYARGHEVITYYTDLCKPIEIYIYAKEKHPFAGYPAAEHPKRSKLTITDTREKTVNFFYCSTCASTLDFAIILQTQVPLQKFSFLSNIIIP